MTWQLATPTLVRLAYHRQKCKRIELTQRYHVVRAEPGYLWTDCFLFVFTNSDHAAEYAKGEGLTRYELGEITGRELASKLNGASRYFVNPRLRERNTQN